jgi:anti-sigma-K factor RskA
VNDSELDALLGAFALDALDPEERARVEEYLAANPIARREVDEMRESAASLALAPVGDEPASSELWDRISASIAAEPRTRTVAALDERRRRPPWPAVLAVAAAIVVVVVVVAVSVVAVRNRGSDAGNLAAAFDQAHGEHGAREVALKGDNGATLARAVLLPDGTGYLRNDAMAALPAGKTYQLWAVSGNKQNPTVISAGVLGADPKTVAFHTAGPVNGLALTVEREPGVVKSTQPVYALAPVT